jgi:uncharacterized membrane protein YuzA (DUF378 family)
VAGVGFGFFGDSDAVVRAVVTLVGLAGVASATPGR